MIASQAWGLCFWMCVSVLFIVQHNLLFKLNCTFWAKPGNVEFWLLSIYSKMALQPHSCPVHCIFNMFYNEHKLPSSMRDWNAEILWFACFWTPQQGSFSTHTHCKHTQRFNLRVCLLSTFHISSLKDPHGRRADEGVTVLLPNRHTHRKLAVSTETHTHCSKALLKTFISFLKSTKTAEAVSSWCILYFSVFLNGNTSDHERQKVFSQTTDFQLQNKDGYCA